MRTLQLITAFFVLFAFQALQVAKSSPIPNEYFSVTMPFELNAGKSQQALLDEKSQDAMQILLLRLTGQQRFIDSGVGQRYIQQARGWLANYNIKPRYEDGVEIGKNVQFQFDADRLKKAFSKQYVKLWSVQSRPKTLVMGSFVQQGSLQKMTSELLNYRIDIDYRDYPENIGLPYFVPDNQEGWVFPVEPEGNRSVIQENLLANDQQNLLSFKLAKNSLGVFELNWYLFNLSGVVIGSDEINGADKKALMKQMFASVAQTYVKLSAVKTVNKNHILLNVNHVTSGDVINQLEKEIQAQQPIVRSAYLSMLNASTAQFDIEYQGDLQDLKNWLQKWSLVDYVGEIGDQTVSVNIKPYLNTMIPSQLSGDNEQ